MAKDRLTAYFDHYIVNCFRFLTLISQLIVVCVSCPRSPAVRPCTDYKACGVTFETMQRVLAETETQIRDSRVRLPFSAPKVQKENTVVVTSGETANFSCPIRSSTGELVWMHQNKRIPYARWYGTQQANLSDASFMYSFAVDTRKQHVNLFLHSTPMAASGEVQCLESCGNNGTLCPLRVFTLKVRPSSTEVFAMPLYNQSTGLDAPTFFCVVNARYPIEEFRKRIIWRFNKQVVFAHPEHPFHVLDPYPENPARPYLAADHPMYGISNNLLFRYYVGFMEKINPNVLGTGLQILNATLHSPGRVECWYQVDPDNDEWLIDAAYLTTPS